MKQLSPLGGAYTVADCVGSTHQLRQCVVVLAMSRGVAFPMRESLVSLFKHNPWIKDLLLYVETVGEQAMTLDEALHTVSAAANDAGTYRGMVIHACVCERVMTEPRPFVGPKVCTYTAAAKYKSRVYIMLDLDMWYFDSLLSLVPRARAGNAMCVREAGTHMLYHAMFDQGGIYNGDRSDLKAYPYFSDYKAISFPMCERNNTINTGLLVLGQSVLTQLAQVMASDPFQTFAGWMMEKKDAFTGNREQALVNLALIQTDANIILLEEEWNYQLVKGQKFFNRPDGFLENMSGPNQRAQLIRVMHFNGYAAPTGPSRMTHACLSQIQDVLDAAGLQMQLNSLAQAWPNL